MIKPLAVWLLAAHSLTLLTFGSVGVVLVTSLVVGYVRDRFDELEERRAVQAWNLKQLLPHDAMPEPSQTDLPLCGVLTAVLPLTAEGERRSG